MKKIFEGLCIALLLVAIIAEAGVVIHVWKKLDNVVTVEEIPGEVIENEVIESTLIEEAVPAQKEWRVVVKKLPVYGGFDVATNVQNDAVAELERGDVVSLIEEGTSYAKVKTQNGLEGYVWFDCIAKMTEEEFQQRNEHVVVVDAGHQSAQNSEKEPVGPGATETKAKVSSGTQGVSSRKTEHQLNLEIALKVEEVLEEQGYTVVMIRKSPEVNISNMERAMVANQIDADVFVRLHADGSENPDANGSMTIVSTDKSQYDVVKYYNESKRLATDILDFYTDYTGIKRNRIMESDTYSGINWCTLPVTILEMGYMTNPEEDMKMQDSAMQKKMADGISDGIINYFENSYVE